jgi:predicted permease
MPKKPSRSERIYRRLLRLFPFDFQREYASEMERAFRDERKHAARKGPAFALRLWWRTLAGFITAAPGEHLDVLRQDIRFGLRSLGKYPGFTFVAVLALAIGIGASLAVFSLANTLLLKPLAVGEPDGVVRVFANNFSNMDYRHYVEYRDRNHTMSDLSAFQGMDVSIRGTDGPEAAAAFAVTGNYFGSLRVTAGIGRTIGEVDDQPGATGAAMLSDAYWRRRFGADPGVIGRPLVINGSPFTVVGVAPSWFTGTMAPYRPDLWISWNNSPRDRSASVLLMGRLRPGTSVGQAQADLSSIATQLTQEQGGPIRVSVYTARALNPEFYIPVAVFSVFLMAIVGLVLTIACLNIATMLLARSVERSREMGIRIALGAGRGQIVRQLLTEGFLLSAAGGGAAAVVAALAAQTVTLSISGLPAESIALDFEFDWRLGLFAVGVSIATTLVFALVPALQCAKTAVTLALKDGALTTVPTRSRLRATFVVAQVALSTLLLVVGALLVRTLTSPQTANRGFETAGVLSAGLNLTAAGYTPERGLEFQERLLQRLETTPGVVSANIVSIVPLTLSNVESVVERDGSRLRFNSNTVSRGHFRTLGIPFLEGRDFDANDRNGSPEVGIVNERLARRLWPNESPIGKRFEDIEIVGVVRDSKYIAITEDPKYFLYRPIGQSNRARGTTLLVKTGGDPLNMLPAVRVAVQGLDPNLPLSNVSSLDQLTTISLVPLQIAAGLAGALGLVALVLGAIGIYGVVSYLVRQRSREIGIRVALGAQPAAVVRLMTRQVMGWTAIGLGLGLFVSFGASQLLTGLIYGITPTDPITFVGITVLLASTAFAAGWFPARRATRIDPLSALRDE